MNYLPAFSCLFNRHADGFHERTMGGVPMRCALSHVVGMAVTQSRPAFVVALLLLAVSSPVQAENWPGWRGPNRNGVSSETGIPVKWSADEGIAWKTPIPGSGISNPVIWNDRVFLTASDGFRKANLHVICLSVKTGKILWDTQLWGTAPTRHHGTMSSMASPAPVTDGKHVYAFFGTGDVFKIDLEGDLVWQRSLADEYGRFENRFAASSSPLLYKDTVLLQCDHYGDSYVIAIDKESGANRWKVDRPKAWLSWSSPRLVESTIPKRHELIICGSQRIDALNPDTGETFWTVGEMRRECIPTPVFGHGRLYAVSGPKGPTLAIRPGGSGDISKTHVEWRNARGAPFVPSAILVGDYYYLVDDSGISTCLNAHTGKRVWQSRLTGRFTASPVSAENRLYFINEAGTCVVIKANQDEFEEIAQNPLGEPVFASPAISQGRLFIRTARHLVCIRGAE